MEKLNEVLALDVNGYASKKQGLTYLSWANAWKEFIKIYPKATYVIKKDAEGLPCFGNDKIGYVCYTEVTVDDITHEMWLPVMDNTNKSMKTIAYKYKTRNGEKEVQPMTMFDVNKTVMRCLTKNLAMFGLGLYIYAGEDLPEDNTPRELTIKEQINNILQSGKVPAADKQAYINDFKADASLVNQKTLTELKAKYLNA